MTILANPGLLFIIAGLIALSLAGLGYALLWALRKAGCLS